MNRNQHAGKGRAGFTLVEMAVVIMILGFLTVAFSQLYALRVKHLRMEDTVVDVKSVITAIAGYRASVGAYPCPAPLNITAEDPRYGRSLARDVGGVDVSVCELESIPLGTCSPEGVCVQESVRDNIVFSSGGVLSAPGKVRVIVGAVPFRQLDLPEGQSLDGYGNRIQYVVTERLTVPDRFEANIGGIAILNQEGETAIEPESTAHFFIHSFGENGQGAHTRDGVMLDCDTTDSEGENCDLVCFIPPSSPPGTPPTCNIETDAQYRMAELNSTDGTDEFDDVVDYFMEADVPLWQTAEANSNHIHQKPGGRVGFGFSTAFPMTNRGENEGDMRAFNDTATPDAGGVVMLNQICNETGTNCFPATKISGTPEFPATPTSSLACPANTYMSAIDSGNPVCTPLTAEIVQTCPPGQYMTGVDSTTRNIICSDAPPSGCPTQEVGICSTTRWLSPTAHNRTASVTAGASRVETYRCRDGSWSATPISTSGLCTCTPAVTGTRSGLSCGAGYTGTYTETTTRVCPAGTTTTTNDRATACVCAARPPGSRTRNCPAGETGIITDTRTWTCTGPNSGTWGNWVEVSNTCACNAQRFTQNIGCPTGMTGSHVQFRDRICPQNTYTAWQTQTNTCRCGNNETVQDVQPCPAGYDGEIVNERTSSCNASTGVTWSPWTQVSNTCTPIPPRICNWNAVSSAQSGQPSSLGSNMSNTCNCGDNGPCFRRVTPTNFTNYQQCRCD